jgi:hypothetical protein
MDFEKIVLECLDRQKAAPAKAKAVIVDEVLSDIAQFKAALRVRPEFAPPSGLFSAAVEAKLSADNEAQLAAEL